MTITKKAFLLQFRDDISAEHEVTCFLNKSGLKREQLIVLNAITDKIDQNPKHLLNNIDAIFMGGSGQYDLSTNPPQIQRAIKQTKRLFDYIFETDFPTLAVCFGHQLMAQLFGGEVVADDNQSEVGEFEITLNKNGIKDPIFEDLPAKFIAQLGHKESIVSLPSSFVLLAKSVRCFVQAYKYKNNVYGVQFHPELDKSDIGYRLRLYPTYSENKNTKAIIDSLKGTPLAQKVLLNFANLYLS